MITVSLISYKTWTGHGMVERRGAYNVLMGKPEGKNHLEDPSVDGG